MGGLTTTTPSTSGEGGSIVHDVPQLPEAVVEVTDFMGDWKRVKNEAWNINRTNEFWTPATTRVHVVVRDRAGREIGDRAFN